MDPLKNSRSLRDKHGIRTFQIKEKVAEEWLIRKPLVEEHFGGSSSVSVDYRSTFMVVFNCDGTLMGTSHGDHAVRVWDVRTLSLRATLRGHSRTPWCVTFHPENPALLASGCLGGEVRVWDLMGMSEIWRHPRGTAIASLSFHPTSRILAIASGHEVIFWDWSLCEALDSGTTGAECDKVRFISFSSCGDFLYSGVANGVRSASGNTSSSSYPLSHPSFLPNNPGRGVQERRRRNYMSDQQQPRSTEQRFFRSPSPIEGEAMSEEDEEWESPPLNVTFSLPQPVATSTPIRRRQRPARPTPGRSLSDAERAELILMTHPNWSQSQDPSQNVSETTVQPNTVEEAVDEPESEQHSIANAGNSDEADVNMFTTIVPEASWIEGEDENSQGSANVLAHEPAATAEVDRIYFPSTSNQPSSQPHVSTADPPLLFPYRNPLLSSSANDRVPEYETELPASSENSRDYQPPSLQEAREQLPAQSQPPASTTTSVIQPPQREPRTYSNSDNPELDRNGFNADGFRNSDIHFFRRRRHRQFLALSAAGSVAEAASSNEVSQRILPRRRSSYSFNNFFQFPMFRHSRPDLDNHSSLGSSTAAPISASPVVGMAASSPRLGTSPEDATYSISPLGTAVLGQTPPSDTVAMAMPSASITTTAAPSFSSPSTSAPLLQSSEEFLLMCVIPASPYAATLCVHRSVFHFLNSLARGLSSAGSGTDTPSDYPDSSFWEGESSTSLQLVLTGYGGYLVEDREIEPSGQRPTPIFQAIQEIRIPTSGPQEASFRIVPEMSQRSIHPQRGTPTHVTPGFIVLRFSNLTLAQRRQICNLQVHWPFLLPRDGCLLRPWVRRYVASTLSNQRSNDTTLLLSLGDQWPPNSPITAQRFGPQGIPLSGGLRAFSNSPSSLCPCPPTCSHTPTRHPHFQPDCLRLMPEIVPRCSCPPFLCTCQISSWRSWCNVGLRLIEVARYMYAFCQNEYFSSTAEAPLAGDVPNALLTVSTLLFSIDAFLERLITSVASAFPISSPWINTSSPFPMPQPARETSSNPTTDDVEEPRRRLSQWTGFLWDIHCRLLSGSGDHSWRTRDPMELLRCHTFCFHPDYVFPMPQEIPQEFRNEIRLLRLNPHLPPSSQLDPRSRQNHSTRVAVDHLFRRDILLLSRRLIHTFRIAFDGYPIVSMYPASLENCMNALRDSVRALIHTSCFLSTLSRVRRDATDNERYMNQICSLLERLEPHLYRTLPVLPISRIPQVVGSHRPETLAVSSESDDVVFNNPQAGIQGRRVGDRVVFEAVPVPLSSYVSTTVYSRPTRTSTSNFNSDRTTRQSGVRQPALRQVRVILDRMMFDDMPLFTNRAFEVQCLNYRVQKWDLIHHDFFLGFREPSMRVVCSGVKLHNDNSVSISQDETKLAAITRTENRNLYELSVFSLSERSLGHKLHSLPVFSSAVSVAFSPSGNYIAVGLATARLVYVGGMPSMAQAMADVYKLGTPLKRNHCNKVDTEHDYDGPSSFKKSSSLLWVRELTRPQSPGSARNLSLNAIQWLPTAGHGFVYGTNRGEVIMLS